MKTSQTTNAKSTLKSYVLRNHNGHRLIVLKRRSHTARLQYNPTSKQASLWVSDGVSSRPLTLRKVCTFNEALQWLVSLEVALNDRERLAIEDSHLSGGNAVIPEDTLQVHLGKPLEAFNAALTRKAG